MNRIKSRSVQLYGGLIECVKMGENVLTPEGYRVVRKFAVESRTSTSRLSIGVKERFV